MDIKITPSKLSGSVRAIASKPQAQRVFICAALSDRPMEIAVYGVSGDTETVINCLRAMGTKIRQIKDGRWRVEPLFKKGGGKAFSGKPVLKCGESGAAFRFLLPVSAALFSAVDIESAGASFFQPLEPVLSAMEKHGCSFSGETFPLSMQKRLRGGDFALPDHIDARFVSGLLFAAPLLKEDSRVILNTYLESEQYVDLTIDVMERFGVNVYENENGYQIPGKQTYCSPKEFRVEGDWGAGAAWFCAKTMGNEIEVDGLNNRSVQWERKIVKLLEDLGEGSVIDASRILDLVPVLAAAAAVSEGQTKIENIGGLRTPESDRLKSTADMLAALGAEIKEGEDSLTITGRPSLRGGTVNSCGDPQIVMAAAIASSVCEGEVVIREAEAVKKFYPRFFKDFKYLGGVYKELTCNSQEPVGE